MFVQITVHDLHPLKKHNNEDQQECNYPLQPTVTIETEPSLKQTYQVSEITATAMIG